MCSIGDRIKALRLERKMTQAQLAEKLGVSYQAVSKWENGITSPDFSLIPNITRAFSISADILFDLVNPEVRKEKIYSMREFEAGNFDANGMRIVPLPKLRKRKVYNHHKRY